MTETRRLGKRPAVRLPMPPIDAYLLGRPPQPPSRFAAPAVPDWGMLGNNSAGCCVPAGCAHATMASQADLPLVEPVAFTTQEVLAQYQAITGYDPLTGANDTGCVEAEVLQLWRKHGLFGGQRIAGFAPVEPHSILAVHRAIAFYGAAIIGVQLPMSAQEQFEAGQPWTVVPDSPIEGGHCIVPVGYDAGAIQCVTWGRVVEVTWPWWETYVDEVWAAIFPADVEARRGPTGLDIATLTADLDRLSA